MRTALAAVVTLLGEQQTPIGRYAPPFPHGDEPRIRLGMGRNRYGGRTSGDFAGDPRAKVKAGRKARLRNQRKRSK